MSDEQDGFEEWLTQAARDYNRPPAETPRDAMWERIAAARRADVARAGGPPVLPLTPAVTPHAAGVSGWNWARRGLAAAAVLMMGIAIGRYSNSGADAGNAPSSPSAPVVATTDTPRADGSAAETIGTDAPTSPSEATKLVAKGRDRRTGAPGGDATPADRDESDRPNVGAFEVATVQHLTQAEALLTAYRLDERSGRQTDARQLAAVARDLLSTTRLLADAPGTGTDPQVRRLLEDLELVLAQIALLSQERAAGERALIDHALEERAMMPRLRTAIPAGRPIAGT